MPRKVYVETSKVLKPNGKLFVRTFASGSHGDLTGKKISKDTWLTNEGSTSGKGQFASQNMMILKFCFQKKNIKLNLLK